MIEDLRYSTAASMPGLISSRKRYALPCLLICWILPWRIVSLPSTIMNFFWAGKDQQQTNEPNNQAGV